ncbi:zf-TFIIB domain-containing protein [Pseudomarimonas salicorniae]|uniref:Zf-TFIIB domain-containing protein n=1 Tax=Pseudomarimonas salicorniae TaxID=2933270 RepID=A0ABT0GIN1_9GAMM|nr:zf-TFIIB domain-containing protein [Lysobacter sp. CAU 1642]MCK7594400.1 zf-TFIIB domain-containing protein [Lysobacter sp. CAU 1642]
MNCPKCQAEMQVVRVEGGEVDRCGGCGGLWFDMLEDQDLLSLAAEIDTGDPEVGRRHNAIDRISCPKCSDGQPMIRMVDPAQPHIWFESCTVCYGKFFDAGEYRDLAEFTVADWFKRLRARPRPE